MQTSDNIHTIRRPPVVAVMGHIDHGKSTLLDFIRKSNVVAGEAGGITQHISAYEVIHKDEKGAEQKITFLDTPGHEAFSAMRSRGATVADISILVVSAEDGVKAQTLEALKTLEQTKTPYVIAINKIDRPQANIEKTKSDLADHHVYLEGYGGTIPFVPISAKTGEGIPDLLDILLLAAELEDFLGTPEKSAEGVVIEANVDAKKGISATLIIKDGTLRSGMHVVSGNAIAPVRILEDFVGNSITQASFSSPVRLVGFNQLPQVGSVFQSYDTKNEARAALEKNETATQTHKKVLSAEDTRICIPIIIKSSVVGTTEAIAQEVAKLSTPDVCMKIIHTGVGPITENDVRISGGDADTIIIGFHVPAEEMARHLAERTGITIQIFEVIYKLTEWLQTMVHERTPKIAIEKITGEAKILKTFSTTKNAQVVGGSVTHGALTAGEKVRILRRDAIIGEGMIIELQQQKIKVKNVAEGNQFGVTLHSKIDIAAGDRLESFVTTTPL